MELKEFIDDLKEGQKLFGETLAIIVNSALLSLVYLVGIGLTSIIAKIFGKKFLDLNFEKKSYWEDLNLGKKEIKDYYKQF